ncbi:flavin reductase [Chloroflexota bacterium]|nr:flavin reductase [Chloroflexota bacterium]
MDRLPVEIRKLILRPHYLFHNQWALLTAGDYDQDDYNGMTIGWGALGTMWGKPFAFVAVRHSRYTFKFMEKYDNFTISIFPRSCHEALTIMGTQSGRDHDKIAESGLTLQRANTVTAPVYEEAELTIECNKIYANDLNPAHFLDVTIDRHYPNKDIHRIYYGEILYASAIESYQFNKDKQALPMLKHA